MEVNGEGNTEKEKYLGNKKDPQTETTYASSYLIIQPFSVSISPDEK